MSRLINRLRALEKVFAPPPLPEVELGPANLRRFSTSEYDFSRLSLDEYNTYARWYGLRNKPLHCGYSAVLRAIEFKAQLSKAEIAANDELYNRWIYGQLDAITQEGKYTELYQVVCGQIMINAIRHPEKLTQTEREYATEARFGLGGCTTEENQQLVDWKMENDRLRPRWFGRLYLANFSIFSFLPPETREFYRLFVEALDRVGYQYEEERHLSNYCCGNKDFYDRFLSCERPLELEV